MVKYLYDDEEEIWDYYDEDPDDPYPPVIIEINDEQMLKLYEKAKGASLKGSSHEHIPDSGCAKVRRNDR